MLAPNGETPRAAGEKMKCEQGGFSPQMAKHLLQAHACTVATYGSEIWNTASNYATYSADKIEQVFAAMRQAVLGTQQSTTPDAMQHAACGAGQSQSTE